MTRSKSKNIFLREKMFGLLGRFSVIKTKKNKYNHNEYQIKTISLYSNFSHWKSAAVIWWTILSCLVVPLRSQEDSLNNTKVPNMDISALLRSFGVRVYLLQSSNASPGLSFLLLDRLATTDEWGQCTVVPQCLWASLSMSCLCQKSVRSSWTLHLICTSGNT